MSGCASADLPDTANGVLDVLEDAGVVTCRERREPVPDVVTCEDDEAGDITAGRTDTPLDTVRATSDTADGPWVVAGDYVFISYSDDLDHARRVVEALGTGDVYVVDDEGEPERLEP